ncbi:MAG: hypothetical protein K2P81_04615 [Bacteriovoracaceae bacterium]|nr:hypothetical protein [Bacteriovoracaceae bacterium]
MKSIIVISYCSKVKSQESQRAEFNFHGYYLGSEIRSLDIWAPDGIKWIKGEGYLIYLNAVEINKKVLFGRALKVKRI